MKITQAQIRILKSMLRAKADKARKVQAELADQHQKSNDAQLQFVADRVLKKHRTALARSLTVDFNQVMRGYSAALHIGDKENADFLDEARTALKAVPVVGSTDLAEVPIYSLNMVDQYRRHNSTDTSMLAVPSSEVDKWRELARQIDSSFMDGDAKKLVWIIDNFK